MTGRSPIVVGALLLALFCTGVLAHQEAPAPTADFLIEPNGERLTVTAHLPIAALSDVNFPRDSSGRIVRDNLAQPLQVVAGAVASSIELEQDGDALPRPTSGALLTPDEAFVDVQLAYIITPGVRNLSARLQPFRSGFDRVPAVVRFVVSPGSIRTFVVAGASERVNFDPDATQAVGQFIGRAARALMSDWDYILFAICLLVPIRAGHARRSSVVALLAGEAAAATITAAVWPGLPVAAVPLISTVAASAIVVAGLQAIVSPVSRWLPLLALVFGLANGVAIGHTFRDGLSFAGSHPALSFAVFVAIMLLGQLWLGALISAASDLLYRSRVPERVVVLGASIAVCHEALDGVLDRGTELAETTTIGVDHFLTGLTLVLAIVVLLAGLVSALHAGGSGPPMMADSTSAQP
ncbi:MAG: hypothetical protein GEU82_02015 [Luteitalea sp.]|nr:hypothetical protein [Luteitalea sp.]